MRASALRVERGPPPQRAAAARPEDLDGAALAGAGRSAEQAVVDDPHLGGCRAARPWRRDCRFGALPDPPRSREGKQEEAKHDKKEEAAEAQNKADEKQAEANRLEHKTCASRVPRTRRSAAPATRYARAGGRLPRRDLELHDDDHRGDDHADDDDDLHGDPEARHRCIVTAGAACSRDHPTPARRAPADAPYDGSDPLPRL